MEDTCKEFNDIKHLFNNAIEGVEIPEAESDTVVIYPPTIDWNWMRQRPQQIMEQFSLHGYRVYYCNMSQSNNELYTALNPNLTIVHNNNHFIKNTIPDLKRQGFRIVIWVSWAKLCTFLDSYQPDYIIYDYIDDFSEWRPYQKAMVERADLITTTSSVLEAQLKSEFPGRQCFLIPNGCDLKHFMPRGKTPKPREFTAHDGPIIIYSGAWAKWIDKELVEKIAARFKNAMVAVIGSEFGTSVKRDIPNLKYLGYKPYNELPKYLQHSSACIIPFRLEQITIATNPIKMYEYLAAGKQVVSTDIPEARCVPAVHIGTDHGAFLEKIDLILKKQLLFDEAEVYGWLAGHTWEKRFERIQDVLRDKNVV